MRFCDAFNIPIITFEDVPGFLPGDFMICLLLVWLVLSVTGLASIAFVIL